MKIRHLLIAVAVVLFVTPFAFAQEEQQGDDVEIQVATVYVQRVYPHPQGYKVVYFRSDLYPGEVYLPGRWFTDAGGKGEILFTDHPTAPYLQIYYTDGEFSHVRLYAKRNRAHPSWGALAGNEDLSDEFSVETLQISY